MFPMIATLDELRDVKAILAEEAASLGVPPVPAGIMVEVPATAVMAAQFAREADFFSIGTNDLTQYTLAMDRGHPKLAPQVDGLNPAVLRLIAHTVKGAHPRAADDVGVCGGIASDPRAVPILIGIGVDELSVSLPAIPAVKAQIRALRIDDCRKLAERALAAESAADVRALVPDPDAGPREPQPRCTDMPSFKNAFSLLQKIGKCMMLPVSVLPVAGILLGVGSANFSWLPESVSQVMAASGNAIFGNLPLLFAIGVAIGLTENDGVAALAGTVGYVVFLAAMGICAKLHGIETKTIMGIPSIETGVFGGIIVGLIAAWAFNRFYRIQLPSYLGFFAGKRVRARSSPPSPSSSSARCSASSGRRSARGIDAFSHWAVHGRPALAFTIYGVVERALIPFGLHHVWNVPFFFQAGEYTDPATGAVVHGEIARFIAGDPDRGQHDRRLPVQDVGAARRGDRDVARRAAGAARESRRHHDLRGAHRVPHRHHRADRVRLPLRRAGPLRHPRAARRRRVLPVRRAGHQARLHLLARAHRLHRALPEIARRAVAAGDRADLGGVVLRRLFLRDPPLQPAHARPRGGGRSDKSRARRVRRQFALQLVRAFGGRVEHRQPRRVHHAPAREARRRHQGQRRQTQGARRRRRGRRRRRHAGDLRHAQREPEDRDAGVPQDAPAPRPTRSRKPRR